MAGFIEGVIIYWTIFAVIIMVIAFVMWMYEATCKLLKKYLVPLLVRYLVPWLVKLNDSLIDQQFTGIAQRVVAIVAAGPDQHVRTDSQRSSARFECCCRSVVSIKHDLAS